MNQAKQAKRLIYGQALTIAQELSLGADSIHLSLQRLQHLGLVTMYVGKENRYWVAITAEGELRLSQSPSSIVTLSPLDEQVLRAAYRFCDNQDRRPLRGLPVLQLEAGQAYFYYSDAPPDTAAWFEWLQQDTTTGFAVYKSDPNWDDDYCLCHVVKDEHGQWSAHHPDFPTGRQVTLGKSENVTLANILSATKRLGRE